MPARPPNSSSVLAGGVRAHEQQRGGCRSTAEGAPKSSVRDKANDNDGLFTVPGRSQEQAPTRTSPHKNNTHHDTASRRTKALITTRIQSNSRSNIALQLTGTALHLSPVKSLARLHRRSKAAPAAERNVRPSTGLHATAELHAEVQISRSSQASRLAASASPPAPEVPLAVRPGGTRHELRRASAPELRVKDESSRLSTTRAAAPSSQIPSVELHVDALHHAVVNCILTILAA